VFIVEVMGHKVGWLTLYAGIAGGADIILLPEIPYDIDKVVEAIQHRTHAGKGFTILAVAEGAISKKDAELSKKDYKAKVADRKYPSVSYEIADQIGERLGSEVRVAVPGHTQRGGNPCPYDRVLCTRLGSAAAKAIMDKEYGCMIAMVNGKTKRVPLEEVAGKLKMVDPDSQMIKEAKRTGISFGD
jgi:6-phosphofructokinase 1